MDISEKVWNLFVDSVLASDSLWKDKYDAADSKSKLEQRGLSFCHGDYADENVHWLEKKDGHSATLLYLDNAPVIKTICMLLKYPGEKMENCIKYASCLTTKKTDENSKARARTSVIYAGFNNYGRKETTGLFKDCNVDFEDGLEFLAALLRDDSEHGEKKRHELWHILKDEFEERFDHSFCVYDPSTKEDADGMLYIKLLKINNPAGWNVTDKSRLDAKYTIHRTKTVFKKDDPADSMVHDFKDDTITLRCGDCLSFLHEIPDKSINLVLTDLPYGITKKDWDTPLNLFLLFPELERVLKDDGTIALFANQPFTTELINVGAKLFKYCYYWIKENKTNFANVNSQPLRRVEEILIFQKPGRSKYFPQKRGSSFPDNVLEFDKAKNENLHPAQKPEKLLEHIIKTYTETGDIVLDATMGSGSTGEACMNTSRKFIGFELNKEFYSKAYSRLVKNN